MRACPEVGRHRSMSMRKADKGGPRCLVFDASLITPPHKMPATKPTAPRRRNRKRKRRLASSSSSSSASSSDSSSDESPNKITIKKAPLKQQATPEEPSSPSSSSSSSSSPSSSDSEDDAHHKSSALPPVSQAPLVKTRGSERVSARSPSPSPPPVDLPPFLPQEGSSNRAQEEQALRNRFRQFWMSSVADAFSDDLEQIRKVRHFLAHPFYLLLITPT